MTPLDHLIYGIAWLGFGWVHSVLAGETAKRRLAPILGAKYRLSYNLFAALHIALVVFGGQAYLGDQVTPFDWPARIGAAIWSVRGAGLVILIGALTQYDLGRFGGLTQIRMAARKQPDCGPEPLHLCGIHRYVRHPLYAGAYLLLWGGVQDEFSLAPAIWGSVYLAIGTHFEERSLLREHGAAYADYRAAVPALFPWKGRAI
jgi:protein-S-isoprenylcysteine O-methyltransferase Ste14